MIEKTKHNRTTTHVGRYDSSADFMDRLVEASPERDPNKTYWGAYDADSWMGLKKFAKRGETSFDAMRRAMTTGFPEGAALIDKIGSTLQAPTPISIRRRMVWCDQGDELNMQSVWNGDLDRAWRRPHKAPGTGPQRITIAVDAIASGCQDADSMAIKGAAAVKLADTLTSAGYAVRLVSAWHGSRTDAFLLSVTTKGYSDPIDINSLAATTVLPAFFRSLGHLWGAQIDGRKSSGYAISQLCQDDLDVLLPADGGAMTFIAGQDIYSNDGAEQWINRCLEQIEQSRSPAMLEAA